MNENKLGTIISKLRKEKGITQKDLADILNISDKAISRWERGTSQPNLEMIFQISKYFNVSFNDLITARISGDDEDNEIVENIVKEFSDIGKKHAKRIKFVLLFSVIIILILTIAIIFTNTYNRFKVYKVDFENNDFYQIKGVYIETNVKDTLYLGDIKIKNLTIKENDNVSVDIYILDGKEEKILQNYSSTENIYLVDSQSYIEIDNLSKYFDNLYLRVSITDSKNKTKEYIAKLNFVLDFTNNKVIYSNEFETEAISFEVKTINEDNIKQILLDNGFEVVSENILSKKDKNIEIIYRIDTKIISINFEKNDFSYRYRYRLNNKILEVIVFDKNSTEVQKYNYNVENNNIECVVGSCTNYKSVIELFDEKILYLLK